MSFNLSRFAGGASSGASFGTMIAPGIGTAIGAGAGALLSLFEGDQEAATFNDRHGGQVDMTIQKLMNGRLGKMMAANATGKIRSQALDNLRMIGNTPGIGRNASVMGKLSRMTMSQAADGIVDAQLKGEQLDTNNMISGSQMAMQQRQFEYNDFLRKEGAESAPTALESVGDLSLGSIAGSFMSKMASGAAGKLFPGSSQNGQDPSQKYGYGVQTDYDYDYYG
jgi:hypothetical protein